METLEAVSLEPLEKLFSRVFDNIVASGPTAARIATETFAMVLCARKPISAAAMASSLPVIDRQVSASEIFRVCKSLIIEDTNTGAVAFFHASCQEFVAQKLQYLQLNPKAMVAMNCMKTCAQSIGIADLQPGPDREILQYSTIYWAQHCHEALKLEYSGNLASAVDDFVFEESDVNATFSQWIMDADEVYKELNSYHHMKPALQTLCCRADTPVFMACAFGLSQILEKALDEGVATIEDKNDLDQSGLYLASSFGHVEVANVFLRRGAKIAVWGGKHGSPLQAACANGNIEIVKLLCEQVSEHEHDSLMQALSTCINRNHEEIALYLLKTKVTQLGQHQYRSLFALAAAAGTNDVLHHIKVHNLSTVSTVISNKALLNASRTGKVNVVQRLIRSMTPEQIAESEGALSMAAVHGHEDIIEILANAGVPINSETQFDSPLCKSASEGQVPAIKKLIKLLASRNEAIDLAEALHVASKKGHAQAITALIDVGADVNEPLEGHGMALETAAYAGHVEAARTLVKNNASPRSGNKFQDSYEAALISGQYSILQLFKEMGCEGPYKLDTHGALASRVLPSWNLLDTLRSKSFSPKLRYCRYETDGGTHERQTKTIISHKEWQELRQYGCTT